MHVVEMRNPQPPRQPDADETHLFVRMNRVVSPGHRAAGHGQQHQPIERQLGERRANADLADERWFERAKNPQVGKLNVAAERIRDEVDLVPQFAEGLDAVVLAEGGAARLEERLRREHQDAHGSLYLTEPYTVMVE